jgi:hypothetical protein
VSVSKIYTGSFLFQLFDPLLKFKKYIRQKFPLFQGILNTKREKIPKNDNIFCFVLMRVLNTYFSGELSMQSLKKKKYLGGTLLINNIVLFFPFFREKLNSRNVQNLKPFEIPGVSTTLCPDCLSEKKTLRARKYN